EVGLKGHQIGMVPVGLHVIEIDDGTTGIQQHGADGAADTRAAAGDEGGFLECHEWRFVFRAAGAADQAGSAMGRPIRRSSSGLTSPSTRSMSCKPEGVQASVARSV